MKKSNLNLIHMLFLAFMPVVVFAQVSLPKIFGDNMVLQQGKKVTVWGNAAPAETVTVKFQKQTKKTKADDKGHWSVKLNELTATKEPQQLTVQGKKNKVVLDNVLIGEVWLASGQSNMEYSMSKQFKHADTKRWNPEYFYQQYKEAKSPIIRVLYVEKFLKADTLPSKGWQTLNEKSLAPISAAGYFFALSLMENLDVPVGLISTSWGGTPIETWIPEEAYTSSKVLRDSVANHQVKGTRIGERFRKMVAPMAPYALKGFLWYQGETNLTNGDRSIYAEKQKTLIESWRSAWKDNDLSFYYVQLAPHIYSEANSDGSVKNKEALPLFREAQTSCLSIPHTGMIVTTDLVDDAKDIHPSYKWVVGERLARWALAKDYGKKNVVYSGPTFKRMSVEGDKIILEFGNTGSGLTTNDGKAPDWFHVKDETGNFTQADAAIEGNKVILSRGNNRNKPAVRFAWDETAMPNLCNKEGLPAVPFRIQ